MQSTTLNFLCCCREPSVWCPGRRARLSVIDTSSGFLVQNVLCCVQHWRLNSTHWSAGCPQQWLVVPLADSVWSGCAPISARWRAAGACRVPKNCMSGLQLSSEGLFPFAFIWTFSYPPFFPWKQAASLWGEQTILCRKHRLSIFSFMLSQFLTKACRNLSQHTIRSIL